jgi:hypothetical protein
MTADVKKSNTETLSVISLIFKRWWNEPLVVVNLVHIDAESEDAIEVRMR